MRCDKENGLGEVVGVEEEGRSGACRGQQKERLVLRTKGGAARAQQKRNSGAHSRMHSRTHKNTPTIAHAHTYLHARMVGKTVVIVWSEGVVARESSLKFSFPSSV